MAKLPWFKFYPSDWLSDEALQGCSMAAQGLWINMVATIEKCNAGGYLRTNDKPVSSEKMARLFCLTFAETENLLSELKDAGVYSEDEHGIYSRKIKRRSGISVKRSVAGKKGAQAKRKQRAKQTSSKPMTSDIWYLISKVLPKEFDCAEFKQAWSEWETYRQKSKKRLSEFAAKKQAQHIAKEGWDVQRTIAAIDHSIANDYQGLFEPSGPAGRQAGQDSQQRGQDGGAGAQRQTRRGGEFEDTPLRPRGLQG